MHLWQQACFPKSLTWRIQREGFHCVHGSQAKHAIVARAQQAKPTAIQPPLAPVLRGAEIYLSLWRLLVNPKP
jgi:hypothetical protein